MRMRTHTCVAGLRTSGLVIIQLTQYADCLDTISAARVSSLLASLNESSVFQYNETIRMADTLAANYMYVTENGIELFQTNPTDQMFSREQAPVVARAV